MGNHSRRAKRVGRNSYTAPLPQSTFAKSPSAFLGKKSVPKADVRDVQPIENIYEFFTKQRPLSWQYFSRTVQAPLVCTGRTIGDNIPKTLNVRDLDVNECLVINSFYANILYRPIEEIVASSTLNYYVPLASPYIVRQRFDISKDLKDFAFYFNLVSENTSLYEANLSSDVSALDLSSQIVSILPTDGFMKLDSNVLENGDSSTALYMFESGNISVQFTCLDTLSFDDVTNTFNFPANFFPPNLSNKAILPYVTFDIRGHIINKNDAELLKTLIQNN